MFQILFSFLFLTKDNGGKKGATTEKNNRANENSDEANGDDDESQDGGQDRNDSGRRDTSQELEQVLRNTGPSTVSSVLEVTKYQGTTTSNTSVPGVKVAGVRLFTVHSKFCRTNFT